MAEYAPFKGLRTPLALLTTALLKPPEVGIELKHEPRILDIPESVFLFIGNYRTL